jgi:Mn-dependent DtxR family transcriptional regulator
VVCGRRHGRPNDAPGTPLRTAEVTARLGELDGFLEYAESSVTKVLNDLGRLKLVTNLRGKGYWVPS